MSILWLVDSVVVDGDMAMDSCMMVAGGWSGDQVFLVKFPRYVCKKFAHITHLELWAVIIAVKVWGKQHTGKIIRIHTDNEAMANIINSGRSQDILLQAQLRELLWWLTMYQFKIKSVHISGVSNRIPDMLSRLCRGITRIHQSPSRPRPAVRPTAAFINIHEHPL